MFEEIFGPDKFLNIERIRVDTSISSIEPTNSPYFQYRITLTLPFCKQTRDFMLHKSDNQEEIEFAISKNISALLSQITPRIMEQLREYKQQTGSYDTSYSSTFLRQMNENIASFLSDVSAIDRPLLNPTTAERTAFTYGHMLNISGHDHVNITLPPAIDYINASFRIEHTGGSWNIKRSKNEPERKAMLLLYQKIGKKKFKGLKKNGYFEEKGKYGTYKFYEKSSATRSGGVSLLTEIQIGPKTRPVEWHLCVQSSLPDMPIGDIILSRWLEFKADEDNFLKTANFRDISVIKEITTPDEAIVTASDVVSAGTTTSNNNGNRYFINGG